MVYFVVVKHPGMSISMVYFWTIDVSYAEVWCLECQRPLLWG